MTDARPRGAAVPARSSHGASSCPALPCPAHSTRVEAPTSMTPEVPTARGAQSSNSSISVAEPLVRTAC